MRPEVKGPYTAGHRRATRLSRVAHRLAAALPARISEQAVDAFDNALTAFTIPSRKPAEGRASRRHEKILFTGRAHPTCGENWTPFFRFAAKPLTLMVKICSLGIPKSKILEALDGRLLSRAHRRG